MMKNLIERITGRQSRTLPLLWSKRKSLIDFALKYYDARVFYDRLAFAMKHFNELYCKGNYYDFRGILLAADNKADQDTLRHVFLDTLVIHCLYDDDYNKDLINTLDMLLAEGSYLYADKNFNIMIQEGDVVIDAGAWIGDFSAVAAYYGAIVYAFEPCALNYEQLIRTSQLMGEDNIIPIKMALADIPGIAGLTLNLPGNSGSYRGGAGGQGNIELTTVDDFVRDYGLKKVDFIKSDIEGYERHLLRGARNTLQQFAPKLSLCTYHHPDDPKVLATLIMDANPAYHIVQMAHKLYAAVI